MKKSTPTGSYRSSKPRSKNAVKSLHVAAEYADSPASPDPEPVSLLLTPPPPPPVITLGDSTPEGSPNEQPKSPWIRMLGSNGIHYYYNSATGDSTYVVPARWVDAEVITHAPFAHQAGSSREVPLIDLTETPPQKKSKGEEKKEMSALEETAERYNVSVNELAKYIDRSLLVNMPAGYEARVQAYRSSHIEKYKFDRVMQAKLAEARAHERNVERHMQEVEKHKNEAALHAEIGRAILENQRIREERGRKPMKKEDKENSLKAGRDRSRATE